MTLPEKVEEIVIGVHVDQDGEGFLTIRVHLAGPDLVVLNKVVSATANLFDTRMTATGFDPPLPLMSPGEDEFSVRDVLADCAIAWLASRWPSL